MQTLIQFAGDDQLPRPVRKPTAYTLFRLGHDTRGISEILHLDEATILERINVERSQRLGLPNPYKHEE